MPAHRSKKKKATKKKVVRKKATKRKVKPKAKPRKPKRPALSPKMLAFIREYLVDYNGKRAAERAGYSPASARQTASELLGKPAVKKAIEQGELRKQARADLTIDAVLEQLADNYQMAKSLGQVAAANRTTELQGRHLGMFTEKHEHEVKLSLSDLLARARARREARDE